MRMIEVRHFVVAVFTTMARWAALLVIGFAIAFVMWLIDPQAVEQNRLFAAAITAIITLVIGHKLRLL